MSNTKTLFCEEYKVLTVFLVSCTFFYDNRNTEKLILLRKIFLWRTIKKGLNQQGYLVQYPNWGIFRLASQAWLPLKVPKSGLTCEIFNSSPNFGHRYKVPTGYTKKLKLQPTPHNFSQLLKDSRSFSSLITTSCINHSFYQPSNHTIPYTMLPKVKE